jgi:hypothetical protein
MTAAGCAVRLLADIERLVRLYGSNPDRVLRDQIEDLVEQHFVEFKRAIRREYPAD